MSTPKIKTVPDLSATSQKHLNALSIGSEQFFLWQRNVIDKYKSLTNDAIKKDLQDTSFPYAVLFENWINDFNISSGFRSANAFNARELFYVGNKKIDKRGMCGIHNYMDIHFLPTIEDLFSLQSKYRFVGIDNMDGAVAINDYKWQDNSLMIFGSEGVGLTPGMQAICQDIVYIPQYGSIRSINCSAAASICMNDFITKYKAKQ